MRVIIGTYFLPHELWRYSSMLRKLEEQLPENFFIHAVTTTSDELIQYDEKLNPQILQESIQDALSFRSPVHTRVTFDVDACGTLTGKNRIIRDNQDATHFLWLDSDIMFDEYFLTTVDIAIKSLDKHMKNYIITPETVRLWDETWDCIVNKNFLAKPLNFSRENNVEDFIGIQKNHIYLEEVNNTYPGQPRMKFGAGWGVVVTKGIYDIIQIPESFGHYGPGDDTFLMWCLDGYKPKIPQYKINGYIIAENLNKIKHNIPYIDRKEEYKKIAESNFKPEYDKWIKNLKL